MFQVGCFFVPILLCIHSSNTFFLGGISFCESSTFKPNLFQSCFCDIYTYTCHFLTHLIRLFGPSVCKRAGHDGKWVSSCWHCHVTKIFFSFSKILFKVNFSTQFPIPHLSKSTFVKIELIVTVQSDILTFTLRSRCVSWAVSWGGGRAIVRCFVVLGEPWHFCLPVSVLLEITRDCMKEG